MNEEVKITEADLPEIHHVGLFGKMKVRFLAMMTVNGVFDKRKLMFLGGGLLVLVGVIVVAVMVASSGKNQSAYTSLKPEPTKIDVSDPEEPRDKVSPLTGEMITATAYEELIQRRPIAVVVENHPDARPQTGLDQADVVYETLVEGGITRFLPIYLSKQPEVVGPVRSLRKYFLDFIGGYNDPLIMHIGYAESTNPEANAIGELGKRSVKTFGFMADSFWRVSDRVAPHNAYSNTKQLWQKADAQSWRGLNSFDVWSFKDADLRIDSPSVTDLKVVWGSWGENAYTVVWKFDKGENVYNRYYRSDPHLDALTGKQLSTRNILVLYSDQQLANDGTPRITIEAIGEGEAKLFMDGDVFTGTWMKPSRTDTYRIVNSNGDDISINRGQTWIMVVPKDAEVIY